MIVKALLYGAVAVGKEQVSANTVARYQECKGLFLAQARAEAGLDKVLGMIEDYPDQHLWHNTLRDGMSRLEFMQTDSITSSAQKLLLMLQQEGLLPDNLAPNQVSTGVSSIGAGSAAAGPGGVAIGKVEGPVYMGDPVADREEALGSYRQELIRQKAKLSLQGLDAGARDVSGGSCWEPDLAQVYIHLDVNMLDRVSDDLQKQEDDDEESLRDHEGRVVSCLEAVARRQRLVILGGPGAGKSTFMNHFALCLAQIQQGYEHWRERLPDLSDKECRHVPVFLVLRDFANWLPQEREQKSACNIWDFFVSRLKAANLEFAAVHLRKCLEDGRLIVMLDGLDEIQTKELRLAVRAEIEAFVERYKNNRILITCRTASYMADEQRLKDIDTVELSPFSLEKIDSFVHAWFRELGEDRAKSIRRAEQLVRAIKDREDLQDLAPNPLLLSIMAMVHDKRGELPESRAVLYEEAIDLLLHKWDGVKTDGTQGSLLKEKMREIGLSSMDVMEALSALAYKVHRLGGKETEGGLADIGEFELLKCMKALHPDPEKALSWAESMITVIRQRSGLLVEREPEVYTFPHRTFQEYLAGVHLAADMDFEKKVQSLALEGDYWKQVLLLAVGRLVHISTNLPRPIALGFELCPREMDETENTNWQNVRLAGEILLEAGVNRIVRSELGKELFRRVSERLVEHLRCGHIPPIERAEAGRILARLGDPRKEVMIPEETELLTLAAGKFRMGDVDEMFVYETAPFQMARYPVTQAQFRVFVEDGGYKNPEYWPEALREKVWKDGGVIERFYPDPRHEPKQMGGTFSLTNQPVVGISWYEAVAYCRWLTQRMEEKSLIEPGWEIRLPYDTEWEKAARGDDGQEYPWKGLFNGTQCNVQETQIGTTSAVGCFPAGSSPYGVEEMAGNVWEWTASLYDKYPYPVAGKTLQDRQNPAASKDVLRVVRGGSFYYDANYVRCAARYWFNTYSRDDYIGFRVVCALSLPLKSEPSER